jgi:hypothetical protein
MAPDQRIARGVMTSDQSIARGSEIPTFLKRLPASLAARF